MTLETRALNAPFPKREEFKERKKFSFQIYFFSRNCNSPERFMTYQSPERKLKGWKKKLSFCIYFWCTTKNLNSAAHIFILYIKLKVLS